MLACWQSVLALRVESLRSVLNRGGPCRLTTVRAVLLVLRVGWVAVRAVLDLFRVGSSRSVLALARSVLRRAGPCRVVLSRVGGPCRVAHVSGFWLTK